MEHVPLLPERDADQERHHFDGIVVGVGVVVFGDGERLPGLFVTAELLERAPFAGDEPGGLRRIMDFPFAGFELPRATGKFGVSPVGVDVDVVHALLTFQAGEAAPVDLRIDRQGLQLELIPQEIEHDVGVTAVEIDHEFEPVAELGGVAGKRQRNRFRGERFAVETVESRSGNERNAAEAHAAGRMADAERDAHVASRP